jgi:hypothetical protein
VPSAEEPSYYITFRVVITVARRRIYPKMPKRSEEDESEWTIRKDDILNLYIEQDRPLSEVIRVMANQGFVKT